MKHYKKAEHYLTEVEDLLKEFDKMANEGVQLPVHQLTNIGQAVDRLVALAQVHATLATVKED